MLVTWVALNQTRKSRRLFRDNALRFIVYSSMSATSISVQGLEQFRDLAQLIDDATQGAEFRAKTRHERFNVFTTLLLSHDEVRLHTRFLQCLLNPEGYHDCGSVFLNLFFEVLADSPAVNHDGETVSFTPPPPNTAWKVEKEASRGQFGQIDLLLESDVLRIALENKIYAVEQENQLARYTEYLGQKSTPRLVIYLTLDGKLSDTHNGAPYLRISYAHHILRWLDKCIWETVRISSINQTLIQYRELVRNLTGQTLATTAMKTIADFIQQHPDIIRYRTQLDVGSTRFEPVSLTQSQSEFPKNSDRMDTSSPPPTRGK